MESVVTIDEVVGVGAVRFGMNPSQVKKLLGDTLVWEEWMGGNLNDAIYYQGIVLFFDDHESVGPRTHSRLEQVAVRPTYPAKWRGVLLADLTRDLIASLLGAAAKRRDYPNGNSAILGPRFHSMFGQDGHLLELSVGSWNGA
jgi:hypothetical protein